MTIGVLSWVWNPLLKSGLLGSNYDQLHPEWWQYWSNAVYYFCRASLHLEPKNLNRNARFFFGLPRYRSCSGCWNPTWRVVEHKLLKMPISKLWRKICWRPPVSDVSWVGKDLKNWCQVVQQLTYFFENFIPRFGEMIQFDEHMF